MRILFVDDEHSAHVNFCQDMQTQEGTHSLECFHTAEAALAYARHTPVDCGFLDIDLGGPISGLDLAQRLKALQPNIEIAFLTAFDQHTKTSYSLGGRAYLTKPYSLQELGEALALMERLIQSHTPKPTLPTPAIPGVKLRTFGNFDLIVDGRAVSFKTAKAKEALAFLVDQMGGSVSGAQVFFALWEAQEYTSTTSIYVRRTMRALKEDLVELGLSDLLVFARNQYSVDMTQVYCDAYTLLNGGQAEADFFNGDYMKQYSWGELSIPLLSRMAKKASTS